MLGKWGETTFLNYTKFQFGGHPAATQSGALWTPSLLPTRRVDMVKGAPKKSQGRKARIAAKRGNEDGKKERLDMRPDKPVKQEELKVKSKRQKEEELALPSPKPETSVIDEAGGDVPLHATTKTIDADKFAENVATSITQGGARAAWVVRRIGDIVKTVQVVLDSFK